ncbi:MAG: hypothetical protein AAF065_03845 [Verrucomicrobiota bacterium]
MKSLQDHCHHHQEAIYLKLKHASYTIGQLATQIEYSTHKLWQQPTSYCAKIRVSEKQTPNK